MDPHKPAQVPLTVFKNADTPHTQPRAPSYLHGARRRPCTPSPVASLPEKERSRFRTSQTQMCAGNHPKHSPSRSFLKSHTWRASGALPQASAEFGVFPSQRSDPCFINAENQTSTQPARFGGRHFLCTVAFGAMCQCDTVGPHFLPTQGPAPKVSLGCTLPSRPRLQRLGSLSRRGHCHTGLSSPGPLRQHSHPTA